MTAKKVFFTKGVGVHRNNIFSFELALRDAGIEGCNLVPVSSIFPPGCILISKEEGLKYLKDGAITFCVMARTETNKNEMVSNAVGLCRLENADYHGYFFENYSSGKNSENCGLEAESLSEEMLITYLERSNVRPKQADDIKKTNICQFAKGKKGVWTTIISVAVFIE